MNLKQALEKSAALEKRIEELEKRQPVIINNWPQPPAPVQPVVMPGTPYWPHDSPTCGSPEIPTAIYSRS